MSRLLLAVALIAALAWPAAARGCACEPPNGPEPHLYPVHLPLVMVGPSYELNEPPLPPETP